MVELGSFVAFSLAFSLGGVVGANGPGMGDWGLGRSAFASIRYYCYRSRQFCFGLGEIGFLCRKWFFFFGRAGPVGRVWVWVS